MEITDSISFAAAIRSNRKRLKVTQKELALTSGTGLRFIIDLEKGKPTCQLGKALEIARNLGLRLELRDDS
jgi:HTH-type transcriptional regulator / antitoxin HipB